MGQTLTHASSEVLNSWKEIATYLGRGVRTVQRWETELHLPVHRLGDSKRSPVFAFERELRFWLHATKVNAGILAVDRVSASGPRRAHTIAIHESSAIARKLLTASQENRRLMNELAAKVQRMQRVQAPASGSREESTVTGALISAYKVMRTEPKTPPPVNGRQKSHTAAS